MRRKILQKRKMSVLKVIPAKFIDSIAKAGLRPREEFDLSSVRVIFTTGSPLV
jgi:acetoacetyl-CoA synthetase